MTLRVVPALSLAPILFAASLARCGACESKRVPEPSASSSSGSATSTGSSSASARPHAPRPPPPRLPCRIMDGVGEARMETGPDASAPLLINGIAPPSWVDLSEGTRMVARNRPVPRETTFRGPGRIKACVGTDEESWVASGGFDSAADPVEATVNEEWVVTPLGVVRYTAARLSVDVSPHDTRIVISSGNAFLWLPPEATAQGVPGAADDGWSPLGASTLTISSTGSTVPLSLEGARAAVATCSTLAKASSRRLARAACALAGLRLGFLPPSSTLSALNTQLSEGMTAWNRLPDPSASASASPP